MVFEISSYVAICRTEMNIENTENRSTQSVPVSCLSGLLKSEGQYLKRDIAPVVCVKRYCSG